jgi:hypothetical protein
MSLIPSILASALASVSQAHAPPPPPPPPLHVQHERNPEVRIVVTSYFCGDQLRRYSIRYGIRGFEEIAWATWNNEPVDLNTLQAASEALRGIPGFTLFPRCGVGHDLIDVSILRLQRTAGWIRWTPDHMVFIPDDLSAPGRE